MSRFFKAVLSALAFFATSTTYAQVLVRGKIIDATTKEPVTGATIHCSEATCHCGCTTNAGGEFEVKCTNCKTLSVTSVGYAPQQFSVSANNYIVSFAAVNATSSVVASSVQEKEKSFVAYQIVQLP